MVEKRKRTMRKHNYEPDVITDDNGCEVSALDDDYYYWKSESEDRCNPLSDDYNKYDNE
jgi:hypothetical protein